VQRHWAFLWIDQRKRQRIHKRIEMPITLPAFAQVWHIQSFPLEGSQAATSTSELTSSCKLPFAHLTVSLVSLPGRKVSEDNPRTPSWLRHHLKDCKEKYKALGNGQYLFELTFLNKGSIRVVCRAIVLASKDKANGYGGLMADEKAGQCAEDILKQIMAASPPRESTPPPLAAGPTPTGNILEIYQSDSCPVRTDEGLVVFGNIGSMRRSKRIQLLLDRLSQLVVDSRIPDSLLYYDSEGQQLGYASRYCDMTPLDIYLNTHAKMTGFTENFLNRYALDLGKIVAQALYTGNRDVHLGNIDVIHGGLILHDNDRALYSLMGKYQGKDYRLYSQAFPPLNQRDLLFPGMPNDLAVENWFNVIPYSKWNSEIPPSFAREQLLTGFRNLVNSSEQFKLGFYLTLYAFSRLNHSHFESLFSFERNRVFRHKVAELLAGRSRDLSVELWSMPEFFQYYQAHQPAFHAKLASLLPGGVSIPAFTAEEVELLVDDAIRQKTNQICDRSHFEEQLMAIGKITGDYPRRMILQGVFLYTQYKRAAHIDREYLIIWTMLKGFSNRMSKEDLQRLREHADYLGKLLLDYDDISQQLEEVLNSNHPLIPLEAWFSSADLNRLTLDTMNNQLNELSDLLNAYGLALIKNSDALFFLDVLQSDYLQNYIDRIRNFESHCKHLFSRCHSLVENSLVFDVARLDVLQCNAGIENLKKTETALCALMALNEKIYSLYCFPRDSFQELATIHLRLKNEIEKQQNSLNARVSLLNIQFVLLASDEPFLHRITQINMNMGTLVTIKNPFLMSAYRTLIHEAMDSYYEELNAALILPEDLDDLSRKDQISVLNPALKILYKHWKLNEAMYHLSACMQRFFRQDVKTFLSFSTRGLPIPNFVDINRVQQVSSEIIIRLNLAHFSWTCEQHLLLKPCLLKQWSPFFFGQPADVIFSLIRRQYACYQYYCNKTISAKEAWTHITSIQHNLKLVNCEIPEVYLTWLRSFDNQRIDSPWQAPAAFVLETESTVMIAGPGGI
jgi:hypothetical protein